MVASLVSIVTNPDGQAATDVPPAGTPVLHVTPGTLDRWASPHV
jgi:hypothetical protein